MLFDWLARAGDADAPAAFEDQAERRALGNLESVLESLLTEPLRVDYGDLVAAARARLSDPEGEPLR